MYRKEALEYKKNTNLVNRSVELYRINPGYYFLFGGLFLLILGTLTWSLFSYIPITERCRGVLVSPGALRSVNSNGLGRVQKSYISEKQRLAAGDLMYELELPDLKSNIRVLEEEYAKSLMIDAQQIAHLTEQRHIQALNNKQAENTLTKQSEDLVKIEKTLLAAIEEVRQGNAKLYANSQNEYQELLGKLEEIHSKTEKMYQQGLFSQRDRLNELDRIIGIKQQLNDLKMRELDDDLQLDKLLEQLSNIQHRIRDVKDQNAALGLEELKQQAHYEENIAGIEDQQNQRANSIRLKQEAYWRAANVVSHFSGEVMEASAYSGMQVNTGDRLASIYVDEQQLFFRLVMAKEATHGQVRIAINNQLLEINAETNLKSADSLSKILQEQLPDQWTFQVHKNGKIIDFFPPDATTAPLKDQNDAQLVNVSLTDHEHLPRFASLTRFGHSDVNNELYHVGFFANGSAKRLNIGSAVNIQPDSIDSTRFGDLLGEITSISPFAKSKEGITSLLGTTGISEDLMQDPSSIIVISKLLKNGTSQNYLWNGKTPKSRLTPGTMTNCKAVSERQAPIVFAIPLLKKFFYGDKV